MSSERRIAGLVNLRVLSVLAGLCCCALQVSGAQQPMGGSPDYMFSNPYPSDWAPLQLDPKSCSSIAGTYMARGDARPLSAWPRSAKPTRPHFNHILVNAFVEKLHDFGRRWPNPTFAPSNRIEIEARSNGIMLLTVVADKPQQYQPPRMLYQFTDKAQAGAPSDLLQESRDTLYVGEFRCANGVISFAFVNSNWSLQAGKSADGALVLRFQRPTKSSPIDDWIRFLPYVDAEPIPLPEPRQ